ncbi:MAG: NAD(P)H-hydrate dehydratase [Pseudomonadota bacterium]
MTELLTAAQMRAIEQAAIDSGEVTGLELMERAGRGVVDAIFEEWPELATTSHRAVVLCGPGNNGGDGFVVARLLKEWGWEVEVFLYGDPDKLPPDARVNYERWGGIVAFDLRTGWTNAGRRDGTPLTLPDLMVDAVFGTGLSRLVEQPIKGELEDNWDGSIDSKEHLKLTHAIKPPRIVSIDMPSGICADSGKSLGAVLYSDLTVTFHGAKVGHFHGIGGTVSRKLRTVSLGIEGSPRPPGGGVAPARGGGRGLPGVPPGETVVRLVESIAPYSVEKRQSVHKYTHGHALILSGGPGKGGAARLAARGALRIGAGLVTVGCPPDGLPETAARLDAIMCRPVADADALGRVLSDARLNALCLGPGLGVGEETRALVASALASPSHREGDRGGGRAVLLDADALTSFADDPQALFDHLHPACVLTPHAGEFARLFPDIAAKLDAPAETGPAYSKVDATREAAARAGCIVLFKGPDTVIADPHGRAAINSAHYDRAAPWLATAGSGDVLAGFITGLLARGFDPTQAAETAAWLHVECALEFGPGLIAEDLPEMLPAVFRKLNL